MCCCSLAVLCSCRDGLVLDQHCPLSYPPSARHPGAVQRNTTAPFSTPRQHPGRHGSGTPPPSAAPATELHRQRLGFTHKGNLLGLRATALGPHACTGTQPSHWPPGAARGLLAPAAAAPPSRPRPQPRHCIGTWRARASLNTSCASGQPSRQQIPLCQRTPVAHHEGHLNSPSSPSTCSRQLR